MSIAYDTAVAVTATAMLGNEFAIAAFIHPSLDRLEDRAHARSAAVIASTLGRAMPIWYALSLAMIAGAAFEHRPLLAGPGLLLILAAGLWVATIVFTIAMLVPINNRIAALDAAKPYPGWLADRARWDRLHRVRVSLLLVCVILLLAGLLQTPR